MGAARPPIRPGLPIWAIYGLLAGLDGPSGRTVHNDEARSGLKCRMSSRSSKRQQSDSKPAFVPSWVEGWETVGPLNRLQDILSIRGTLSPDEESEVSIISSDGASGGGWEQDKELWSMITKRRT